MNKGPWETRLHKLASAQADVSLPNAGRLISKLDALNRITTTAKDDVGLDGQTGQAATTALGSVASKADAIAQQVTTIQNKVDSANTSRRNLANDELDKLDKDAPGSLSGKQADILQAAVTGATFFLGPLSIVAGPGAVAAVNSFLAANRESTARASVQKISDAMDAYDVGVEPVDSGSSDRTEDRDRGPRSSSGTPSGPSTGTSGGGPRGGGLPGGSFGTYPNAHIEPLGQIDTGGYISLPGGTGGGHTGSGGNGITPGTGIDGSITPDGPIDGGTTSPGWGSGGGGLGSGSGSGGLGSTPGLAAGAGGAIALGGAKLIAAKGGSMLGTGLNAKVGSLGAGAKLGGLNAAAESAAARSGSLAGAGRAGAGGLLGSGSGSGAAGAAGEAGAARGGAGGAGMMGGAGGVGGRSDEKRQGRGLGGPIAPKIDEDQERGPRSAAAGPGGRG